jgi:hypothetical protein
MDCEGYPEQHELNRIKNWDFRDIFSLIDFVASRWNWQDWGVKKYWDKDKYSKSEILKVEFHTGGWSGNEDLINALLENRLVCIWYESWRRGGHYYFEINPYNVGYEPVLQFAKKKGLTKQAIHKNAGKYEWLDAGNKKLMVREMKHAPLLNKDQEVKECDATKVDSSKTA